MDAPEPDDISLVVPTYNRATALRANLDSMLAMHDIAEIVIVDDGSTDDTLRACEEIQDERLRVVSHPSNQGVASARNAANKSGPTMSAPPAAITGAAR